MFILYKGLERIPCFLRDVVGGGTKPWGNYVVIGKGYFVLQAATLLKLAQTTTDPKVRAALVEKAAELNSHVEEARPLADLTPLAPDIEQPSHINEWVSLPALSARP
jgi:hypothetical protein